MSSDLRAPVQEQFDPGYELKRVADEAQFRSKMRTKRRLYKLFGEIYIGRRVKFVYFRCWLKRLNLAPTARILEVGSGDGVFCFFVAKQMPQAKVTGLELNPVEAKICQELAEAEKFSNLNFVPGVLGGPEWKEQFDFLYSLDVLEHIQDDVSVMKEMYAALKPGGSLLVHVPNRTFQETDGRMIAVPDEEAWKINPGHVRQGYSPDDMRAKLEQAGFEVKATQMTQSHSVTYAHRLYAKIEKVLPLRILILPAIDVLAFLDARHAPTHGNTVWAWAQKPQ